MILSISWRQPLWLFIAIQPAFLYLFLRWKKQQAQKAFADEHLLPWLKVQQEQNLLRSIFTRNSAYILSWLLFSLAMAGPKIPDTSANEHDKILMDVILVVDLSRSMSATDVKPSRLRRATLEAYDFLSIVKNARVGVVVYAARAHLFVPLTSDKKALKFYLKDLDSLQLPTRGSDALAAIQLAKKELLVKLQGAEVNDKKPTILWLTDGDIEQKNLVKLELELAKTDKVDTYILALGTEEGAAIPLPDGSWLMSENLPVITKMNKILLDDLEKIAQVHVAQVREDNADWEKLYYQGMRSSLTTVNQESQHWKELLPWLLAPAIMLLIIALFPIGLLSKYLEKNIISIVCLSFLVMSLTKTSDVFAAEDTYEIEMLQGVEAYKKANFAKSKRYFIDSVLNAKTDKNRAIALHNLGNALFQLGDYARSTEVFTDALRYAPKQIQSAKNQALSLAVFIEQEKRRNRKMNQSNFASSNDIAPLFDVPEQLPFMLSSKAVNLLKVSLPKLPEGELNRLLSVDIQAIKLYQGGLQESKEKLAQKEKQQLNMEQARLFFMSQEEKVSNELWKRLFEIEEGFSGELKAPKTIPSVRPW